jgi:hypothetical protein
VAVFARLLVAMIGRGILIPIVSQVALSSAPAERSGLAAGVNDMFRQAGTAVGVAALGRKWTGVCARSASASRPFSVSV